MLKSLIILISIVLPVTGFAQEIDVKNALADHFNRHFSGLSASANKTWDRTRCLSRNPMNGTCIQRGGDKTLGEASIKIGTLSSSNGSAVHLLLPSYGINILKTDLIMKFAYKGTSTGKKQCFPSNVFCGWDWESLHPGGEVVIKLRADTGTSFGMWINFKATPGHNDKANGLAKAAAESLRGKAKKTVEHFLSANGIPVEVIMKN